MIDFTGKTAIVTGGSRGIGSGIVSLLCDCGCEVIYTGTGRPPAVSVNGARYEQLDLSYPDSIGRFVAQVIGALPRIDVLINNAGVNAVQSIDVLDIADWERIVAVNLTGAMRLTRETAKLMKEQPEGGKILNISSIFGIVSREKRSSYSASKTGLIGLTLASALDLAEYGILVNALCPGFTETELTFEILSPDERESLSSTVPLRRFAEVSEIAKVAVFLVSDLNGYMTGQTVIVDGGVTAK